MRARFAGVLGFAIALAVTGGVVIRAVQAATYAGPTAAPPSGNIPVTIWNRADTTMKQTGAAIDIDGAGPAAAATTVGTTPVGLTVGASTLNMGSADAGQNLIYGVADPVKMNAGDYLLLLQAPAGTNRLSVDKNGVITVPRNGVNPIIRWSDALTTGIAASNQNQIDMRVNNIAMGIFDPSGLMINAFATRGLTMTRDGTALAPSYVWGIDFDTGFFHPAAEAVAISTTGVERARFDGSGNLTADVMASFGSATRVVGVGQNLVYGNIDTTSGGNLVLLQNESADKFKVDAAGNVSASGNVNADACFGPTYQGQSSLAYTGNLNGSASNGYVNANALCVSAHGTGAHICGSAEILNSIKCSVPTSPVRSQIADTFAWLQDGPPGFTAPVQDCMGWTSANSAHLGRVWRFNDTSAPATQVGRGYLSTCNSSIKFACCK